MRAPGILLGATLIAGHLTVDYEVIGINFL